MGTKILWVVEKMKQPPQVDCWPRNVTLCMTKTDICINYSTSHTRPMVNV